MKYYLKIAAVSITAALLMLGILVAALNIRLTVKSSADAESSYSQLQEQASKPTENIIDGSVVLPSIDWNELKKSCPDVVGWVYCPDTELDYPIVQAANNETYPTRLATGEYNSHGAIFADCRSGPLFTDDNTLIYGHNMKDGSMFHELINWGNQAFADAHPTIYVLMPMGDYAVQVFSACVVEPTSKVYTRTFAGGEKNEWLDACQRQSYVLAEPLPESTNRIVTFSTCSGSDMRFVVLGRIE